MNNKKDTGIDKLVDNLANRKVVKVVSIIDGKRNMVMALRKLGYGWEVIATELNTLMSIKKQNQISGKYVARAAQKWKALGWIDVKKVDSLAEQLDEAVSRKTKSLIESQATSMSDDDDLDTPSNVETKQLKDADKANSPIAQPAAVSNVVVNGASVVASNGDTYKTLEEFSSDVFKTSDVRFHSKEAIRQAFEKSKGSPKKVMLATLRDIIVK